MAEALAPETPRAAPAEDMRDVETPKQTTCEDVAELLGIPLQRTVKLIAVIAADKLHVLLIRGDHSLNEVKAAKIEALSDFRFASEAEIRTIFNCPPGFLGPVGLDRSQIRVIADRTVAAMSDFVCGANKPKYHTAGVNWGRDVPEPDLVADIRNVVAGDPCADGKGKLEICRGIEVGHIFQLGNKYSQAMNACYLDENGHSQIMEMGCYGIGVSRIVGAAIEQGNDERGIIFPAAIAPFTVAIAPIGFDRNEEVRAAALKLHDELASAGVDVLLDDRGERPGVMFADLELIGIPHRITLGDRGLKAGQVEYQSRTENQSRNVPLHEIANFIKSALCTS
jgi:prolyl-tRNA synthetase